MMALAHTLDPFQASFGTKDFQNKEIGKMLE
jgi:hypothetical protein